MRLKSRVAIIKDAASDIGADYASGFGAFGTAAKLITVLHLRQLNVSKFEFSSLDLLASIANPQTGQGLIGGRG